MGSERNNPRKSQRETARWFAQLRENDRWGKLTPEQQESETKAKEERLEMRREEARIERKKEASRLTRYMKIASSITIEDFFKGKITVAAKVEAFCTIRGYEKRELESVKSEAIRLCNACHRLNYGITREGAVDLMKMHIKHLFKMKELTRHTRRL
ncbi:MAG: hypothetical protein ACRCUJ_11775 [Phocaeicola sp.]